ncbi:MAG TPA: chromosome partitioning protein ParA [Actinobacteria bacterium]|nr:chromosome partitioning protein ParA [Actinomycetota bacterium]
MESATALGSNEVKLDSTKEHAMANSSSGTTTRWPADVTTLSIDVGGTGLKASVLDPKGVMMADRVRVETPYPCPPTTLVKSLQVIAKQLPSFHRVSVGFPGLVRHGKVIQVPAFSRRVYGGPPDPDLVQMWSGFDLAGALARAFKVPVKVANDADVQGCAVVDGVGFEFVMTLGTGCGTAVFSDGKLLPHMELSHAPFRKGQTFDILLGNAARKSDGKKKWRRNVMRAVKAFDDFLYFDSIYIGGGNAKHVSAVDFGPKATIVPNTAGILGGIRIWDLED